jgi:CBS domain-containing protein
MKVEEIMTTNVVTCTPQTDMAAAAGLMWENDCGTLPVVEDGRVVGMITDRDICISAASKNRDLGHIAVGEAITREVYACTPDSDVRDALALMRGQQIRRLPIIDLSGKLRGVLSLKDIALKTERNDENVPGVTYVDFATLHSRLVRIPR